MKPAAEIFHNEIAKRMPNVGVISIYDDVFMFGKGEGSHVAAVSSVFEKLEEHNLTVNLEKCEFNQKSIKFFGLIFTEKGVSPDPEKVKALREAEPPKTKSELRSFLGMMNFSQDFIEHFAIHASELRKLTRKEAKWQWTESHQKAFDTLKDALSEEALMNYFDPSWNTEVVCDGSPFGVSATLRQVHPDTSEVKILHYASRTLKDAKIRYGQVEREALAIHFGCLKYQMYILRKEFTVLTDHQPLISMFNNPKSQMPYRVERIRSKLQGFNFVVKFVPGTQNTSDYLSRRPILAEKRDLKRAKKLERHIHLLVEDAGFNAVTVDEIRNSTEKDENMQILCDSVNKGKIDVKQFPQLRQYSKVFAELSVVKGILMKGHKIVVPKKLRSRVIAAGHEGHQGIVKTKMLLRSKVWYPDIDKDVTALVSGCRGCQAAVNDSSREPLIMSELPEAPWEYLSTDFHGPLPSGEYLISVIDDYSRFPVVKIARSTSPKHVT